MACLLLLCSCMAPRTPAPAPTAPGPVREVPAAADAQHYRINPQRSTLHILVYRGGTMAQLGHNHVLSSRTLSGEIWLHSTLARSGFSIELPVNDLIIDDEQARAAEGGEFLARVSDAARAGTRRNMLKPELLDGERYPLIQLHAVRIIGTREQPEVTVQITLKARSRELTLPVQLTVTPEMLRATGRFDIRQSDFGITPFSVMLGALQVLDQLTIKFELVAAPTE